MIPDTSNEMQEDFEIEEQPSRTYCLDVENNRINGLCDGIKAIEQSVYCILNTERFNHLIYSWNYGVEFKGLYGENDTYVIPEIERVVKEALMQDERIEDINDFNFISKNKAIIVQFKVITILGSVNIEQAVNV